MIPVPVFPYPPATPIPLPDNAMLTPASPGNAGTILSIGKYPPYLCDVVVATSPESLPAAVDAVLRGEPTFTVLDYLTAIFGVGVREISEYELTLENPDWNQPSVRFV